MFKWLLLVSCLVILTSGVPVDEVQCPYLPCPLPPCDHPHPTYYTYHGRTCEGCSQCDIIQKRQLILPTDMCPIPVCANPGPCSVPLQHSTFRYNGKDCPGCPICPAGGSLIVGA